MDDSASPSVATAITGTFGAATITGIVAPGGYGDNDNIINTSDPWFDKFGLTFTVDGVGSVNFRYKYGGYYAATAASAYPGDFTMALPEPMSLGLLGLGLTGLAAARRRRAGGHAAG